MQSRPSAHVLVKATREFLESEVIPVTTDQRLRFRARIAANVLSIVERELKLGPAFERAELERVRNLTPGFESDPDDPSPIELARRTEELTRRIVGREVVARPGDELWQHLRSTLIADLRIANPGYLQRKGEA